MSPSRARHDPGTILSASRALTALGVGVLCGGVVGLAGEPELLPGLAAVVLATVSSTSGSGAGATPSVAINLVTNLGSPERSVGAIPLPA